LTSKVTRSSASELDRSNIARAFATSGSVLKRAQGVYVEDEKGKKYLDMTAGGTTAVGYSHPRLTKALVSQVSRGIDHIDRQTMITEKASELTDELKTFVPNPLAKGKAVFGHSGSDIIEKAIRLVRFSTSRPVIVSYYSAHHGANATALSASPTLKEMGTNALSRFFNLPGFMHMPFPDSYRPWFADGSNYPGTANIRQRKKWFAEALQESYRELSPDQRMLVEYKPFEPAFYHTDIADWGMALLLSRAAGPQAKVLVDTGHHYATQNIEQIVAWLLSEDMLGGFHFNDRRYADDDLTMGSIDPYQVFRIFHEIHFFEWETGERAHVAYMVDQSHNLKGKIEAMIQTVAMAQQLFAKAALVDAKKLATAQKNCDLVQAESLLQDAFATDVRPAIQDWKVSKGLPKDPLEAFRQSGYLERITKERATKNAHSVSSYA